MVEFDIGALFCDIHVRCYTFRLSQKRFFKETFPASMLNVTQIEDIHSCHAHNIFQNLSEFVLNKINLRSFSNKYLKIFCYLIQSCKQLY